jgi:AmmeMemoRadiSam system protein A
MFLSPHHQRVLMDAARDAIRRQLTGRPPAGPDEAGAGEHRWGADPSGAAAAIVSAGPGSAGPVSAGAGPAAGHAADAALSQPAGCFVTLHTLRTHALRGCVGRLDAAEPLLDAVRRSATNVLSDPRFADDPVRLEELPDLQLDVSVLSPLRPAAAPLAFDLLNEGIYLTWGEGRAGCFLPQVARETGWSKEQLLDRLCVEKMGLPAGAWHDRRAKLFVFTTLVIGPEPFETGRTGPGSGPESRG